MKQSFTEIIFSVENINFFCRLAIIIISIIFLINYTQNKIKLNFESKTSYAVAKLYVKGLINNPYVFIQTANIYNKSGDLEKEEIELRNALSLIDKNQYNIKEIHERIKELESKKVGD